MKKILIIGGDGRMIATSQELKSMGFAVETLGVFKDDNGDISKADVILLPVPTSRDGKRIHCPLTAKFISLDAVQDCKDDALILSGGYMFDKLKCIDYLSCDSYALRNAVPTAEGAIAEAIRATDFTLWKSRVLVTGFGRVGKILCQRLKGLECEVTVSARKNADFAMAEAMGISYIHTGDICHKAFDYDIIFNTLDIQFDSSTVFRKDQLIIDLSTLGCMDDTSAHEHGVRYMKLPGLPGKTACRTAGVILAKTAAELISSN